jgi:hypothetical protein
MVIGGQCCTSLDSTLLLTTNTVPVTLPAINTMHKSACGVRVCARAHRFKREYQ